MASLKTDILGKVLFYYELPPIVIAHSKAAPLRVRISTDDSGIILDDMYYPDFSNLINIDIRDVVAAELSLLVPESDTIIQQTSVFKAFHIEIGDSEITGDFTINGFSSEAASKITDIDFLRIPEDYRIPLSLFNNVGFLDIIFNLQDGSAERYGVLSATSSGVGTVSTLLPLPATPAKNGGRFQIELSNTSSVRFSPVFEVSPGKFEQYLFANRYGGFDNIPMDGALEFVPEMAFESGMYSDHNENVSFDSEYIYSQNSGYQSAKVMELASELLCSSQIYHLDSDGEFRRIVIVDSDLRTKSNDSLHFFTFRYKYAEDTRPMSLKGKTAATYALGGVGSGDTQVYPLSDSPMVIEHKRDMFPCVTVVDADNHEVGVLVEHIDKNSIKVSWNGQITGYVYVN